ncbi:long-chain fatty acid--CoA ligase [Planobispora siamensis]|uniref:Fatty-acyl-CoA synthase n=1 Tax=Planobispora siamensis TaxID=936338 RepID=A0A8J3SM83_9ACTN|nr:long-chain fatty acid--CoA ligase [Planobispora siamensis]GIH97016.1 fatty-acyl-CoA synthase [Planobispora siamensis]
MRNQGIGSWPARRARRTPHRIALVHEGRQTTYRELHERVLRLAHALRALGVRRGDRVAYLGPNHPSFVETLFAAGTLGAVFVPLNTRLAVPELAFDLSDSGAAVLVHAPSETAAALEVPHRVSLDDYEELIARSGGEPIDEPVSPGDPCMIMYTSGTTGRPKGAVLSHANITWNSVNVLIDTDLTAGEVTLVVAPLFHTAGLNMTCLPTLLKGGQVVLLGAFDPGRVLELIETGRITQMFGVPTMFDAMAAHPRWAGTDLSSLRTLNCGGAPVPMRTIETYLERGLAFSQGYGMTEASPGVLYLPAEQAVAKAGSAGVPHFFTDVRVVRSDGRDAAPGENGEIIVQGPNVMTGYWGAQPLARGEWLRTGDVGRTDEDGYAYIVDRVKDMFVSGGENVYPAEVESAILLHPEVADCAVIGVPDAVWGEVGRAVVVLRPGSTASAGDILGFLHGQLAKYKIPKSVVWAETIPRTPSGKILKPALRVSYAAPAAGV